MAGHETTALTLSWALYLCAFDQTVARRRAGRSAGGAGRPRGHAADVASLPLIRQIVDETLRMYPPAAFLSRTAQAQDELCGREVRPGDTVILPIYALHRHHDLWRTQTVLTRRALPTPGIDRFAYLPFGDGPEHLHRRELRHSGGGHHPGHPALALPLHPHTPTRAETRDDPDPAPEAGFGWGWSGPGFQSNLLGNY